MNRLRAAWLRGWRKQRPRFNPDALYTPQMWSQATSDAFKGASDVLGLLEQYEDRRIAAFAANRARIAAT